MAEKLTVDIKRIPFTKESGKGFWCILVTSEGTCKGKMGWIPKEGERLTLTGNWEVFMGSNEFKFSTASPEVPQDPKVLLHYVCKLCVGIGSKLEERIWKTMGDTWQTITDKDVKGINKDKVREITEKIEYVKRNKLQVDTVSYLMSKGCSFGLAEKAWYEWDAETIGIVNDNCFVLTELDHVGFCHIDSNIRQNFGITDMDPKRIIAGIQYAMKMYMSDGSTVIHWDNLWEKSVSVLRVDKGIITTTCAEMIKKEILVDFEDELMLCNSKDYLYEKEIWEFANV
jgi:hypothetical protein